MDLADVDRKNGNYYLWATLFNYLAAPVFYVGILQAALCHKLGASAAVANLPATASFFGSFLPIVFACLIPLRWEKLATVLANALMGVLMLLIGIVLILPVSSRVRIAAVIGQCLILGMLNSVAQLFLLQCLRRGTTELGRARALKIAYFFGPMAAVAGSLMAQFILRDKIPFLVFPRDFAVLHLFAVPCAAVTTWCCNRMELAPVEEDPRPSFFQQLRGSFGQFFRSPNMTVLWLAYFFWYSTIFAMPNLSLYTKKAVGLEPAAMAGLILAIRFGSKAVSGYFLGELNIRYGTRAPMIATVTSLGIAMIWASVAPGYLYLVAFGFMGAGELGGTYYPNAVLAWAPPANSTRDLAMLTLVTPVASPFPALHGLLTDHWGFPASFALGIATAIAGLALTLRLPSARPSSRPVKS